MLCQMRYMGCVSLPRVCNDEHVLGHQSATSDCRCSTGWSLTVVYDTICTMIQAIGTLHYRPSEAAVCMLQNRTGELPAPHL